jgi:hypothetical protein
VKKYSWAQTGNKDKPPQRMVANVSLLMLLEKETYPSINLEEAISITVLRAAILWKHKKYGNKDMVLKLVKKQDVFSCLCRGP